MKKIYSILMILAAAAGFTNCAKTELVEPKEAGNGGTVVYATTDAATKTTLADDYKVLWSTGDQINFVKNDAPATTHTFTLSSGSGTTSGTFTCDGSQTPVDGTYTVYYPATYNGTYCPAQNYVNAADISGAPMKATATVSDGIVSDISFKNEGGILRYTVKGDKTIKSINVTSSSPALDVTLNCGNGVALAAEGTVFNIALPAGEYSNATLRFIATDNTVATKTASTFTVTKNKVSLATFESLTYLPEGALKGVFSVSDAKTVHFSQGNLYYDGSKFNFEANQYDFRTYAGKKSCINGASSTTGTPTGHWGLFGWVGASSTAFTTEPQIYGVSTSKTASDYSGNVASEALMSDWGNTIDNSGTWRTLTTAEWQYLFSDRTEAASKVGYATVGGVNGIIILPDNFTDPMKNNGSSAFVPKSSTGWTKNVYTSGDNWNAMETAGAVFLPAAGFRSGSDVDEVGSGGYYWSSTAYNSDYAYCVYFDSDGVSPDRYDDDDRYYGSSVRLITECQ